MQAASDTPTTPNLIGPLPPLPRGEALPVVPTTVVEAQSRFRCPAYSCTMRGQDCAGRHVRAKQTESTALFASAHACIGCEAGKARAELLNATTTADRHDGRRPYAPPPVNGDSGATKRRKAAEAAAKTGVPNCAKCGAARKWVRRPEGHPLRPWCGDCVRDANSRMKRRLPRASTACPSAVAHLLRSGDLPAAYEVAKDAGVALLGASRKRATPKAEPVSTLKLHPACEACGAERAQVRRRKSHPLYPFCYSCVQTADSRLRHRIKRVATKAPRAVAVLLRTGDRDQALRAAAEDGATILGPKIPTLAEPSAENATAAPLSPSQADQPAQPVGHVTEGGGATCPASSPSAAPSASESSTRAARAFSTPCDQVVAECAGDVVGGSVEDCPSLLTDEPGAEHGPGGESLRRPCKPEQAFAAEPACPASVTPPVADPVRTAADLEAPPARSLRDVDGVSGRGPSWRQVAQGLLEEMRESAAADLVEITRLQIQVKKLEAENRQLVRALALSKGFEVDQ